MGLDLNIEICDCPPPPAIPALSRRFDESTLAIELSVAGLESAIAERKRLYSHHNDVRASRVY